MFRGCKVNHDPGRTSIYLSFWGPIFGWIDSYYQEVVQSAVEATHRRGGLGLRMRKKKHTQQSHDATGSRKHDLVWLILVYTLLILVLGFAAPPSYGQSLFSKQMDVLVDGNVRTLYYEGSHDISISDNTIERLIVVIHGASRTNTTYERIRDAAIANGVDGATFVFAPQLLIDDDIAANSLGPEVLFWPSGWRQGHLSTNNGLGRISSFELLNRIVREIVTNNPAIADVVISGHSAGAQYAQRFAASSMLEQDLTAINNGVRVRYVAANPSSMVYMDNKRRIGDSVDRFDVPSGAGCPGYDDYKYGLNGNLNSFVTGIGGAAQVRAQYPSRDVRYLLGENDNDPNSSSLDIRCEANFQGRHRLERGIVFYNHIRDHFGESVHDAHVMAISPNLGHTSSIFIAECGISFLFDIGGCSFVTPTHLTFTVDNNNGAVNLSWMDRAVNEANYEVERSDDGGDTYSLVQTLPSDSVSHTDAGAMPAMQYRYRVRAGSGNDRSAFSNVAVVNPSAAPPGNPVPPSPPPSPPSPGDGSGGGGSGAVGVVLLLLVAMGAIRQGRCGYVDSLR